MADLTSELVWIKDLLSEFSFTLESPMRLYSDNEPDIHIAENLVFHEHTKHIEISGQVVCQKVVDQKVI